jgi:23S rRNA pseudouridine2604 synthase
MSEPVRLSKRLAELVSCSRREAELYIEGGWVSVDGLVVEEPQSRVTVQQVIALHPEASAVPVEPVTILLHQPPDFDAGAGDLRALITRASRAEHDHSGIRMVNHHFTRLTQASPLQHAACGLVVFSQDWRVLRKLTEDACKNEHEYIVEVDGQLVAGGLELLNQAQGFNGRTWSPVKASWQNENRLRFALKNPSPDQIVQLCEHVGLTVLAMKRIRIGAVSMAKLPPGQWRYLARYEKF